jgi:septal ring factor EnvC (AmiA/AmiB activator)
VVAGDLQRAEDHLSRSSDADERKRISEEVERNKSNIAAMTTEERGRTTTLEQMEQQLQTAQDSLEQIESELNAIIARLRPSGK